MKGTNNTMVLSTIGYQGCEIEDFIKTLIYHEIVTLIDIRENPISRKKGFSKKALAQRIEGHRISYIHIPALGSRRETRNEFRENNDWSWFSREYLSYLESQSEVLYNLQSLIKNRHCCLLCFEAHPSECHRSLLVDFLQKKKNNSLDVKHLVVGETINPA